VGHPRLGVIVPRYGANAPARNRLRRRLREGARRLLAALAPLDLVIRARIDAYSAQPRQLAEDLERTDRMMLHAEVGPEHHFYLQDGGVTYHIRLIDPEPAAEAGGES